MQPRSKQNSQMYVDEYRQGQSRTNYYDAQSQQDMSPSRQKGQSRYGGSNKKTQQVADKIQDVI